MIVKILNKEIKLSNKVESVEEIFKIIKESLVSTSYFFSHMRIDGKDVYENHEIYLKKNIDKINMVEVEVKTIEGFTVEVALSIYEYLERAIPEIEILAKEFYSNDSQGIWTKFNQFLEGMTWIQQAIASIDNYKIKKEVEFYKQWNEVVAIFLKVNEELLNIQEGINNGDLIIIADLLSYEIIPILESMKLKLSNIFGNGVRTNAIN
ncbi:hypothetical protein FQB35_02410 [Crassaminicella thermophila]|uniref:Uncharacterized protein n=1 Tax=Crassaminicella thermophila TaxID=2599308 RepID=A0A5C0SBM2_CRATE|nr:hypothetical protein [Crassaminicella thermophila]QEK11312.1 hypothetical protein FQB35_02410 [Crassaminicella thermophila]